MLLTATAEGGVQGATVAASETGSGTAWDSVVGTPLITYDNTHARGALAYKVDLSAVGAAQQLVWSTALGGTVTEMWGRLYLWSSAAPASNRFGIIRFMNGSAQAARLIYQTDGTLQLADAGNAAELTTTGAVATGQWVRIEWHITFNATSAAVEIGLFNDANSTTATETVSGTAVGMGAGCTAVQIGAYLNGPTSTWTGWLDDIEINDTGFPGPIAVPSGGGTATVAITASGAGTKTTAGGGTASVAVTAAGSGEDVTPAPPTFPHAPLDIRAELLIPGHGWVDTIDKALKRDPVTITRGRADESARPTPSKASLTLRDQEGKWANRNPRSPYFGLLGRNTPLRIRVGDQPPYAYMPGVAGGYLSTPDASALDVTGDLDIRIDITPDSWRPNTQTTLAGKYLTTGNQRSWAVFLRVDGRIQFRVSPDGTFTSALDFFSTDSLPADAGRLAVRVTYDVDNGGNQRVEFSTAETIAGPWALLGDAVDRTGTGSVYAGTAALEIGSAANGGAGVTGGRLLHGRLHAFELRAGIDGTVVADPGIADQTEGSATWTGEDGLTWTANGGARLLRPARFHGEVASWPPSWHVSGGDVRVQLQAAGIRRRLSQGAPPVQSTLRRSIPADDTLVAYWPMEDAGGQCASALPGHPPMRVLGSATGVEFAAGSDFVASAPLPTIGAGRLRATVPGYTPAVESGFAAGSSSVMFLCHMPAAPSDAVQLLQVWTTGTAARYDVWVASTGKLSLSAYDREGAFIDSFSFDPLVPDRLLRIQLSLTDRSDVDSIDYQFNVLEQGASGSGDAVAFAFSGGYTLGRITSVIVGGQPGEDLGGTTIGHLSVHNTYRTSVGRLADEFAGYAGETAAERMVRLAEDSGVPLVIRGELATTAPVGPQRFATFLELMDEAADADGGILHDSRDELGFEYRTQASMYNQARRVTLDYTAPGEVPPELQPVEDDQAVRNDVTVTREGGSSARVVVEDGPLSVLAPPDGVGTYDEALTLNLATDDQAGDAAGWRTHLGTWDEARYPTVTMWPHTAGLSSPSLVDDIASLDVGDRFAITNPPTWLPPADIDQLAQGYTEVLKPRAWETVVNATPAGPWTVAVVEDARADTAGSALAAAMDETATGLVARPAAGPFWDRARAELFWTTDPTDLPFALTVGGEEMTVTAVAAAGDAVADAFGDTVASGWGTADTGQSWTVAAGSASDFSAASSTGGVITSSTTGTERGMVVDAGTPHQHVLAHSNTPVIPTGAPITWGAYLRWSDASNYYWVGVEIGTDSSLTLRIRKRVAGTLTLLESAVSAATHATSPWRILRAEAVGSSIRAKVWVAGDLEPDWEIETTDTDLTAGDSAGCVVRRETGSTNGTSTGFDLFAAVPQAQTLTVVRSVNGISKPHVIGEDVELARPAYLAR